MENHYKETSWRRIPYPRGKRILSGGRPGWPDVAQGVVEDGEAGQISRVGVLVEPTEQSSC